MARRGEQTDRIDKIIGEKIHALRLASGMSRQQLAEAIGVTHQQTQKYEKGVNRISAGRLSKIALALGKPVSYFFDDIEESDESGNLVPTQHQRMCIEVSRNFMRIRNADFQIAVNALVRSLASE